MNNNKIWYVVFSPSSHPLVAKSYSEAVSLMDELDDMAVLLFAFAVNDDSMIAMSIDGGRGTMDIMSPDETVTFRDGLEILEAVASRGLSNDSN